MYFTLFTLERTCIVLFSILAADYFELMQKPRDIMDFEQWFQTSLQFTGNAHLCRCPIANLLVINKGWQIDVHTQESMRLSPHARKHHLFSLLFCNLRIVSSTTQNTCFDFNLIRQKIYVFYFFKNTTTRNCLWQIQCFKKRLQQSFVINPSLKNNLHQHISRWMHINHIWKLCTFQRVYSILPDFNKDAHFFNGLMEFRYWQVTADATLEVFDHPRVK